MKIKLIPIIFIAVFLSASVTALTYKREYHTGSKLIYDNNQLIGIEDEILMLSRYANSMDHLVFCMNDKDVMLYENMGNPLSQIQIEAFGSSYFFLNRELCQSDCDYKTPTWDFNGKIVEGVITPRTAETLVNC